MIPDILLLRRSSTKGGLDFQRVLCCVILQLQGEWPIEEKQPLNGAQTGAYVIVGVIFLYLIYAGWKHRQENVGIVHGLWRLRVCHKI